MTEMCRCEKCVNWECPLHIEPCVHCAKDLSRPSFSPQAFKFDDLGTAAKARVMMETRSNIAEEEGTCSDTDEQLIQYIRDAKHLYMKDGELLE